MTCTRWHQFIAVPHIILSDNVGDSYKLMPSGAGHDAQIFADFVPTAMLFVPSIGGISHNTNEETKIEDLVKGIEVLKDVLFELWHQFIAVPHIILSCLFNYLNDFFIHQ